MVAPSSPYTNARDWVSNTHHKIKKQEINVRLKEHSKIRTISFHFIKAAHFRSGGKKSYPHQEVYRFYTGPIKNKPITLKSKSYQTHSKLFNVLQHDISITSSLWALVKIIICEEYQELISYWKSQCKPLRRCWVVNFHHPTFTILSNNIPRSIFL